MSITALGELVTELGDTAQAIIEALSRQPIISRTVKVTETKPGGKRKAEVATTKSTSLHFTAFHVLFFFVVTGLWTPARDKFGNLVLKWWDTTLASVIFEEFFDGGGGDDTNGLFSFLGQEGIEMFAPGVTAIIEALKEIPGHLEDAYEGPAGVLIKPGETLEIIKEGIEGILNGGGAE